MGAVKIDVSFLLEPEGQIPGAAERHGIKQEEGLPISLQLPQSSLSLFRETMSKYNLADWSMESQWMR